MSKYEVKFGALEKKIKAELKTLSSYQYDEIVELGGYIRLLDDIKKVAEEMLKLEESIKTEAQKALEAEEREEREARAFVSRKPKKKILD